MNKLFAQEEKKGSIPGWLWVILAAAVLSVFRKLGSKKLAGYNPYAPNNGGQNSFGRSAAPTNTGGQYQYLLA